MEKTKKIDVRFKDWSCTVQMPLPTYGNGRKAICLIDAEDGQPIATATVNKGQIPVIRKHLKTFSIPKWIFTMP